MYNLDSQFKFNNEENLLKLGAWLRWKLLAEGDKRKDAETVLTGCGFSEEQLLQEWEAQVRAQTKPLPRE